MKTLIDLAALRLGRKHYIELLANQASGGEFLTTYLLTYLLVYLSPREVRRSRLAMCCLLLAACCLLLPKDQ
jgi:hypothetical protein